MTNDRIEGGELPSKYQSLSPLEGEESHLHLSTVAESANNCCCPFLTMVLSSGGVMMNGKVHIAGADIPAWMKKLPPHILHTAMEIHNFSKLDYGTQGNAMGAKKRKTGLELSGAAAFSMIMNQLLQSCTASI